MLSWNLFQYMLLLRGATAFTRLSASILSVSIHAPLARSNGGGEEDAGIPPVSIHAPLARSNGGGEEDAGSHPVSIHAPLARSNSLFFRAGTRVKSFNTCSSCEEQRRASSKEREGIVSIHAPLARSNPWVIPSGAAG